MVFARKMRDMDEKKKVTPPQAPVGPSPLSGVNQNLGDVRDSKTWGVKSAIYNGESIEEVQANTNQEATSSQMPISPQQYADIVQRFLDGKITNNMAREELGYGPPLEVNKRAQILQTAEELINGDRAQTYGPPEVSFGRIADIWNAMGMRMHVQSPQHDIGTTVANEVTPTDVALILIGMKLSRTVGAKKHEDSWLDLAGYAGLGAELSERE